MHAEGDRRTCKLPGTAARGAPLVYDVRLSGSGMQVKS